MGYYVGSVVDQERFSPDPDPTSYLNLLSFPNKKFCTEMFEAESSSFFELWKEKIV
jgi:hypothetical protein